jgi:copper chaperone
MIRERRANLSKSSEGLSTSFVASGEDAMITLEVSGMVCDGCAKAVTRAIEAHDPSAKVVVSRQTGRVTADTALSPEAAAAAVSEAGYDARPLAS